MLKMYVDETELEPVGIGAQIGQSEEGKVLCVQFKSKKQMDEAVKVFEDMTDDSAIILENEKRKLKYTGYTVLDNRVTAFKETDGSYVYAVNLKEKSAIEVARQAAADVAYMAVMTGVEL